ncbi:hypothetical protein CRUP_020226 [Coryphaenoides rupestris]|nr:hypothetical protein CRUP_020226 [Coryphaenoides rupestris]
MDSECSLPGQLESVERSVVFLKQEHVTLLHGLHLELLSLQKRCTELACELSLKSPGKNQIELQEEVELLEARCQAAEAGVAEKQRNLGELRQELSHKGVVFPSLGSAMSPVVKPKRRSVARPFPGQLRLERARECVPMEMITGPAEPTAMPDPALFLHPRRHRVRSRHSPAQRLERAEVEEGGGEGLVEPQDEAPRLSASIPPPAAQTQAE